MATFQAKIGWKRQRNRENKNYHSVPFLPDEIEKTPKKIAKNTKKFKKLKNTFRASFQAKIGQKRLRRRENRNYRYIQFQLDA